jgi:hypothetical protein
MLCDRGERTSLLEVSCVDTRSSADLASRLLGRTQTQTHTQTHTHTHPHTGAHSHMHAPGRDGTSDVHEHGTCPPRH